MKLRADGNVLFNNELISFQSFIRIISDFENCKIHHYKYSKVIDFYSYHNYDEELHYGDIVPGSPNYKNLQRVLEVVKEYFEYKRKKDMYKDALNKGIVPEKAEDKKILYDYVNGLIETAESRKNNNRKRKIKYTASWLAGSNLFTGSLVAFTIGTDVVFPLSIIVGLPVSMVGLAEAIKEYGYYKGIIQGIDVELETHRKVLALIKGASTGDELLDQIKQFEFDNEMSVKRYNDRIINGISELIELAKQLPFDVFLNYKLKLEDILLDYKRRVNEILGTDKGSIGFGKAKDVYGLHIEFQRILNEIELDMKLLLNENIQLNSINDEIDSLRIDINDEQPGMRIG